MSNLKKVLALALALAMVMTMFAGASIKTVLDVKDADQFTDAQLQAASLLQPLGVLAGMGADELGAGKVTRAQMVAFIYRLTNGGDDGIDAYYSKTSQYKDVDTEAWYAPYLNWAYASKVAFGYTDGNFGVNDYVTGAQAAAMLVRLLGKEASGNDYALQAQSHAIALGLDDGITTRGLYENALDRGDMFILLANTLMCEVKDTTLAEEVFDLEILYNVVLIGAEKTVGISKNDYTVFTFRGWTSNVDTLKFASRYLMVEDESDIADDIGCKYTLLVSKSKDANGYRTLYAAYEAEQDGYYNVITGTVDDGALVFEGKKQNVFFDKDCVFYVDEKVATKADFIAAYGKANWGSYKLIDNDGDGYIEYAIIERLTYAKLGVEKITAKVTAISAKGALTLTTEDGTVYEGIKYGTYAATNANGSFKDWVDTTETIQYALGINQTGYFPFTGISDVYYDFDIVYNSEKTAGYVFAINVSDKTAFAGNYGIFVGWSTPLTMYKNMGYAQFMNENNEYFWAYVKDINEINNLIPGNGFVGTWPLEDNSLVYFTDGDYSDDVVSFYTANYWNANQTYNWYEAFEWQYDVTTDKPVVFTENVVSELMGKETVDYSKLAKYGKILAVMDLDDDAAGFEYWNTWTQEYVFVNKDDTVEMSNRKILIGNTEYAVEDYKSLQGYRFYEVTTSHEFYGIEDIDECVGFVFLTDADITITLKVDPFAGESFQIYMANGFWHLRNYVDVDADDINPTIMWGKYTLVQGKDVGFNTDEMANVWGIKLADGTDPEEGFEEAEFIPMYEIIKGFDNDVFTDKVDEYIAKLKDEASGNIRSAYTLLNAKNGVVFAYGQTVIGGAMRWVAFDVDTFNRRFFADETDAVIDSLGGENETPVHDELIYTVLGGKTYVKAMKITAEHLDLLPYGWIEKDGASVAVFAGLTGAVNTNGWQIEVLTLTAEGVKSEKIYTRIGLGTITEGSLVLIKKDAEGVVTSITDIGGNIGSYLDYVEGWGNIVFAGAGTISSATSFWGEDFFGNYYEVELDTEKTVVYVEVDDGVDNIDGNADDVYLGYSNEYKKEYKDCAGYALETTNFILVTVYVK